MPSLAASLPPTSHAFIANFDVTGWRTHLACPGFSRAVKLMLAEAARAACAQPPVEAAVRFPLPPGREEDALVDLVAAALPPNARLAVFDAVTSNTALKLPLKVRGAALAVMLAHPRLINSLAEPRL